MKAVFILTGLLLLCATVTGAESGITSEMPDLRIVFGAGVPINFGVQEKTYLSHEVGLNLEWEKITVALHYLPTRAQSGDWMGHPTGSIIEINEYALLYFLNIRLNSGINIMPGAGLALLDIHTKGAQLNELNLRENTQLDLGLPLSMRVHYQFPWSRITAGVRGWVTINNVQIYQGFLIEASILL
jgi:hypothetical protein